MARPYKGHFLTEDRKKLAGDNVPFVWWYVSRLVKRKRIGSDEIDEISGYLLWHLCMAAETFDFDRGIKFSTYAMRAMNSGFLEYIRKKESFDARFLVTDFTIEENWHDRESKHAVHEKHEPTLKFDDISYLFEMVELDALEEQIVFLHYEQRFTYNDIGEMMGLTGERIRQLHVGIVEKIKSYVEENGLTVEDFV